MSVKIYNKLVRDRIPEIIEASDRRVETRVLSDGEYIDELEKKLEEEVSEYLEDKNLEEMADVLEVLRALCIARGFTLEELEAERRRKVKARGGFEGKIFLEFADAE